MRLGQLGAFVLLALVSCTRKSDDRKTTPLVDAPPAAPGASATASPPAASGSGSAPATAFPEALPGGEQPSPVEIVIKNITNQAREFGDRQSPLSGLSIAHERGLWGELEFDRPPTTCECRCGPQRCPLCGPRRIEPISIAARGEQRYAWNGLLRRYRRDQHDRCYEVFAPPRGSYWMIPGGKQCVARKLELPARAPIVVELSDPPQRACDPDPHFAERSARLALHTMAGEPSIARDRAAPLAGCNPSSALLVAESAIGTPPGAASCSIAVARGQHEIEARVWLGQKDYSTFLDPAAIDVTRVRYAR